MVRAVRMLTPVSVTGNLKVTQYTTELTATEPNVLAAKDGVLYLSTIVDNELAWIELGSFEKINALSQLENETP